MVCIAPAPVRTDVARGLLPESVPHRDAAANAGRSALLIAALTQPGVAQEVLLAATEDWLHQDYRASAMPQTAALVHSLRAAGLPAVVSGAGPSVLAFLARPRRVGLSSRPGQPGFNRERNGYCMAHKLARRRTARRARPAPGVPAGLLTREAAANPSDRVCGASARPRHHTWN